MGNEIDIFDRDGRHVNTSRFILSQQDRMGLNFHDYREYDRIMAEQAANDHKWRIELIGYLMTHTREIEGYVRTGDIPIGVGEQGEIITIPQGRNVMLITDGKEPAAPKLLSNIARFEDHIRPHGSSDLMVHADVAHEGGAWNAMRRSVSDPLRNTSPVRTLLANASERFLREVAPKFRSARIALPGIISGAFDMFPDAIRHGEPIVVDVKGGSVPIVGPHNVIIEEDLRPGDIKSDLGAILSYLSEQIRYTPFAQMFMQAERRNIDRSIAQLAAKSRAVAILSDGAVGNVREVGERMGQNLSGFNQSFDKLAGNPPPQDSGFHVIGSGGRPIRFHPFD